MQTPFSDKDKKWIQKKIWKKYSKVAKNPDGLFKYPTGRAGLTTLNYDPEFLKLLPETVAASYCGVGNPFTLGPITSGDAVLDVGCGAGVDTLISAMMIGPSGKAVGIDLTPVMLKRAKQNLSKMDLTNVVFEEGSAETLPFEDNYFHVAISNGALNLIPDKSRAFGEIYRVLKTGGRLMVADEILTGEFPREKEIIMKSWAR
ncbi:MAG: methyltransferase domain-containing protein [Deltaproteobacteria bacterium]|jgi:SAM-dependent methyltransferase|nr:methyltransferase domain-containing protein [Deltaproteobacteria bacterium]MBW2488338.1 methyltransferase domain-containing protein [Deltaproteobacteria bacterium]MBW2515225.1 methyltransferase domain-containing protein [Deltaproteobacteria bacterium]